MRTLATNPSSMIRGRTAGIRRAGDTARRQALRIEQRVEVIGRNLGAAESGNGDWPDDAAELSPASEKAPKKSVGCDDDPGWGEVSDWMASSAAEAAPMAGNMAELRMGIASKVTSILVSKRRAMAKKPVI